MLWRRSSTLRFGLLPSPVTKSDIYQADAVDAVGEAGCSSLASSDHVVNSANSDVPLHRSLHELQDNASAIANTHQMLSNEEQDAEA